MSNYAASAYQIANMEVKNIVSYKQCDSHILLKQNFPISSDYIISRYYRSIHEDLNVQIIKQIAQSNGFDFVETKIDHRKEYLFERAFLNFIKQNLFIMGCWK